MTNTTTSTEKPRGRAPGVKVESLDYRASKVLRRVDFDRFVDLANSGSDRDDWRDELVDTIINALRKGDNPIF